jgi:hypothetical protein
MYDAVRRGMKLAEEYEEELQQILDEGLDEALTFQQRQAISRNMRKNKAKMAAGRKRAARRKPTPEKIAQRAQKRARNLIRAKVIGGGKKSYDQMSYGERSMIDIKVAKKKKVIDRIAKKLIPIIRKEVMSTASNVKKVKEDLDLTFESLLEVRQDRDIKDKEGTQPSKYYSGLSKSTKDDRDAHFKKGAKMNDDNPDAYKLAPGDASAKTKESEYTRKYRDMYEENVEEASCNDSKSKKRYHEARKKNGTIKLDGRFRAFRKKPVTMEESFDCDEDILALIEQVSDDINSSVLLDEEKALEGLKKKAEKSGISYGVLKKVYDRGLAAWRTGHRPGTTPQQWGYARVNSFITGGTTQKTTDADLWKMRNESLDEKIELDSFFDLNEQFELSEASILDKALAAIHKHVLGGTDLGDISFRVSRASGVNTSARSLEKQYIEKYGNPKKSMTANDIDNGIKSFKSRGSKARSKLFTPTMENVVQDMNEEFENLMEAQCDLIGMKQIKAFEKIVDQLFKKFGIDFNFTRHFGDRMSDERNTPCITMKELAEFIKKIYAKQGKSLKGVAGAEAVIKDLQTDLNIPVAVKYDQRKDEFDVVMKTIMRKKNFKSPDKIIGYK